MAIETTYTSLRENLAAVLDRVTEDQEVVLVKRRGAEDVALIPARELSSLMETAHLLRSPANARRLLQALKRAEKGQGRRASADQVRRELGLER
jgi:antitoxin YefM